MRTYVRRVTVGGNEYEITYGNSILDLPRFTRLDKVPACGVMAHVLADLTGRPPFQYIFLHVDEPEEIRVTLALGHNWSDTLAWRVQHKWAETNRPA